MKKLIIFVLFIIGICAGFYLYQINNSNQSDESITAVESYIKSNISELSPVKESLGGTFFVTDIEIHDGVGVVGYEDGHNAYVADFSYTVDDKGKPSVNDFVIRPTP